MLNGVTVMPNGVLLIHEILTDFHNFVAVKKIISLFLLLVFVFNMVGVIIVFEVEQLQIRQAMEVQIKNGIAPNQLQVITITANHSAELSWKEENEFSYKGILYDVVKTETRSHSTKVYYCISDKKEAELFANLNQLVAKNTDNNTTSNHAAKNLLKFLSLVYVTGKNATCFTTLYRDIPKMRYEKLYLSPTLNLSYPPPKAVTSLV